MTPKRSNIVFFLLLLHFITLIGYSSSSILPLTKNKQDGNTQNEIIKPQVKVEKGFEEMSMRHYSPLLGITRKVRFKEVIDIDNIKKNVENIQRRGDNIEDSISQLKMSAENGNRDAMFYMGDLYHFGTIDTLEHIDRIQCETPLVTRDAKKAFEYYKQAADMGHPEGQRALGLYYTLGRIVPQDHSMALMYYTFAALGGSLEAKMVLGYKYLYGESVPKECKEAVDHYQIVAQAVSQGVIDTGLHWLIDQDRLESSDMGKTQEEDDIVQYYQYAADSGDVKAQVTLGTLHLQGVYVPRDFNTSLKYFHKAAFEDNPSGIYQLGFMYRRGYAVEANNETALQYFEKAARLGSSDGQAQLGIMYLEGASVERNFKKAISYFKKASEKGNADAMMYLGLCYFYGLGVQKDYAKTMRYFVGSGHGGNLVAQFNLGQMYRLGLGATSSCSNAVQLFKKVAERGVLGTIAKEAHICYEKGDMEGALLRYERSAAMGVEKAQHNAAWMIDQSIGFENLPNNVSNTYAFEYYRQSASQSNPIAHLKLGDYYYYGKGTFMDHKKAAVAYQKASNMHNAQATFNLGYMHQHGLGLPKDLYLAKRYYDLSSELNPEAYIPSCLALVGLGVHYLWEYPYLERGITNLFKGTVTDETTYTSATPDVFKGIKGPYKAVEKGYDWEMIGIFGLVIILALVIMIRQHVIRNVRPAQ